MMYYLMNFIPVMVNILVFPWVCGYTFYSMWMRELTFCFNVFLVPAYLLLVNITAVTKKRKKTPFCLLMAFVVIVLNAILDYVSWGMRTGLMFNPDAETVMVVHYVETAFPMLIVMAGMGVYHIVRKVKARKQKKD